ncbi:hypothetical protein PCH_Pc14g01920 [Penicillium rubens Wisconsin 54-1255]|uniref:Uncharacterized protein n=1 Tax=Penicillium rubens (strain ATCC 28089 / DSM 1075 / NRRL 1951 / Wisconsin 54-1255) TaxID=500485 RepID=B6H620_PENRW|nr:hypothetical protein PCH_Pc14g01920 [Penicillium rubens Wisconsin 54-1255]
MKPGNYRQISLRPIKLKSLRICLYKQFSITVYWSITEDLKITDVVVNLIDFPNADHRNTLMCNHLRRIKKHKRPWNWGTDAALPRKAQMTTIGGRWNAKVSAGKNTLIPNSCWARHNAIIGAGNISTPLSKQRLQECGEVMEARKQVKGKHGIVGDLHLQHSQYMLIAPSKQINAEATEMQGTIGTIFTGRAEDFGDIACRSLHIPAGWYIVREI